MVRLGLRRGLAEFQGAQFQKWNLFAVHQPHLLAKGNLLVVTVPLFPHGRAPKPNSVIGVLRRKGREYREQHLSELRAFEGRARPDRSWRPEEISQALRRRDQNGGYVFERQPHVVARSKELKPGSNSWIGVEKRAEGFTVEAAGKILINGAGAFRVLTARKPVLPLAFSKHCTAI